MTNKTPAAVAPDLHQVAALYADNLRQHGTTSRGVGWKDDGGHALRFDQLLSVVHPDDWTRGFSVNDLGTGYGALHDHLLARGARLTRFVGYDISAAMLEEARRRMPGDHVTLIEADHPTETTDYAIASGIFNVRFGADEDDWRGYMERTILDLATSATKGIAFNALSTYVDWKEPHLYYADPLHFFDFCKRHVSRHVALLHDTPLYEWTLVVRKEATP